MTNKNTKKVFGHLVNVLLIVAIAYLLLQKVPVWIANVKAEGESVTAFVVGNEKGERVSLPKAGEKQVIIFWATWCGPCKVELARFNEAVREGQLKAEQVLAVSLGEDPKLVYQEAKNREYLFTTLVDPENAALRSLKVEGTPQTYHINAEQKISYASMGLSLLAVWRAENFLKAD